MASGSRPIRSDPSPVLGGEPFQGSDRSPPPRAGVILFLKRTALALPGALAVWGCAKLSLWAWFLGRLHRPGSWTIRGVEWFNVNVAPAMPKRPAEMDAAFFRCVNVPSVVHTAAIPRPGHPPGMWMIVAADSLSLRVPPVWASFSYSVYSWDTGQAVTRSSLLGDLVLMTPLPLLVAVLFSVLLGGSHLRSDGAPRMSLVGVRRDAALTLLLLLPLPYVLARMKVAYSTLYSRGLEACNFASEFVTPLGIGELTLDAISLFLLGLYPLVFLHLRWRRAARFPGIDDTRCHRCRYPLDALPRCPECGTDRGANPTGRLTRGRRRILLLGYGAIPFVLVAPFWLSWLEMGVDRLLN